MIPFPGESLRIYWATANVADTSLRIDIQHREGSRTLAPGDEWRAWVDPSEVLLLEAPDTDVAVSWVVEVDSGTATLTVGEAGDPTYVDATVATSPLGTFPVTGPTTLVVPSGFTTADLLDGSPRALTVSLAAASGSAVVSQVKLRAWPDTGAAGTFVPFQPDDVQATPQVWTQNTTPTPTANYATQDDMRAAFNARVTASAVETFTGPMTNGFMDATGPPRFTPARNVGYMGIAYLARPTDAGTANPPGVFGVDWVNPPDEVPTDDASVLYPTVGAPGDPSWVQGVVTVRTGATSSSGADKYPADGQFYVAVAAVPSFEASGVSATTLTGGAATPFGDLPAGPTIPGEDLTDLPLPEFAGLLRLVVWHDGHLGPVSQIGSSEAQFYRGRFDTFGDPVDPLTYTFAPGTGSYWSPAAQAGPEPLRLRQRSDGLGLGSVRVRGVASRQMSVRVRGYL